MDECMNRDLQGRQAPLDDAGLAVLDDLTQGLKVLVAQGEDHPAWVVIFPPQPHRLLTAGLHLLTKGQKVFTLFSNHLLHTKPHFVQAIDTVAWPVHKWLAPVTHQITFGESR